MDMETCSWCTDEVPDNTLTERFDGARVCRGCKRAAQNEGTWTVDKFVRY